MDVHVPLGPWTKRSACRDYPDHLFFDTGNTVEGSETARAICATCPVRLECLTFAINACMGDGIFGGTTADQRRRMRSYFHVMGIRPTIDTVAATLDLFATMTKVEQKRLIADIRKRQAPAPARRS